MRAAAGCQQCSPAVRQPQPPHRLCRQRTNGWHAMWCPWSAPQATGAAAAVTCPLGTRLYPTRTKTLCVRAELSSRCQLPFSFFLPAAASRQLWQPCAAAARPPCPACACPARATKNTGTQTSAHCSTPASQSHLQTQPSTASSWSSWQCLRLQAAGLCWSTVCSGLSCQTWPRLEGRVCMSVALLVLLLRCCRSW